VSQPRISVIIPTKNRRRRVIRAIRSAQQQRGVEVEIIVVDDGSTDGTMDALSAVQGVHLIRNESSQGVGSARNQGAAVATADWLAFLDDDDLWAPAKLEHQLATATARAADWVYCGAIAVDRRGRVLHRAAGSPPEDLRRDLARFNAIPATASNLLLQRRVFESLGGFDRRFGHFADWEFALRLSAGHPGARADQALVAYIEHGTNMHVADVEGAEAELDMLAERVEAMLRRPLDRRLVTAWLAGGLVAKYGLRTAVVSLCRRAWAQRRPEFLRAATVEAWRGMKRSALGAADELPPAPPWARQPYDLDDQQSTGA
jgi:glycosyltransferase involved in cell wall biosynthesis